MSEHLTASFLQRKAFAAIQLKTFIALELQVKDNSEVHNNM